MAKIKWKGTFVYNTTAVTGKPIAPNSLEGTHLVVVDSGDGIPVRAFSVKGGIYRQLEMSSMDTTSLPLEFQDVRKFSNLKLILTPKDSRVVNDLITLSTNQLSFFLAFNVTGTAGSTMTHNISLVAEQAKIIDLWISDNGKKNSPTVILEITDPRIDYTQKDFRGGYQVTNL